MVAPSAFEYRAAAVGLTVPVLRDVIYAIYENVRQDAALAPIFLQALGDKWDHHIEKVLLFWLTATRPGSGYQTCNPASACEASFYRCR